MADIKSKLCSKHSFLGIEFAPLVIPFERRIQTLSVLQWILTFLALGPLSTLFCAYILFYTSYYWLMLIYAVWYIYDIEICNRGGRTSTRARNWAMWKHYRNYFPIQLVKTVDLDPKRNYLFCSHPHGFLSSGSFCNFATEANNVSTLFKGLDFHLLTLEGHFWFPIYRDYFLMSGACAASKGSIDYLLSTPNGGKAAVLIVGGARESLEAHPKSTTIYLKNRKGFVRLALENGAPLVPVYSFGETEIYDQVANPRGSLIRRLQEWLMPHIGIAPIIFKGRGMFQYSFGVLPQRKPISTVVGKPVDVEKVETPTQEQIDELHEKYMTALRNLYNENREKYAVDPSLELDII